MKENQVDRRQFIRTKIYDLSIPGCAISRKRTDCSNAGLRASFPLHIPNGWSSKIDRQVSHNPSKKGWIVSLKLKHQKQCFFS